VRESSAATRNQEIEQVMRPESKDVVDVSQPHGRTRGDGGEELRLEELYVQVCQNRGEGRAHGSTERL